MADWRRNLFRLGMLFTLGALALAAASRPAESAPAPAAASADQVQFFETQVRPVLEASCF
jgi:hypothetical protein